MPLNIFDYVQFFSFFSAIGFFLMGAFVSHWFRFNALGVGMALWAIAMAVSAWTTVCRG